MSCPDCASTLVGRQLIHDDSCPLYLGLERATASDARWFKRHRGRTSRTRPATPAERTEQALLGHPFPDGDVTVTPLAPGVCMRTYGELTMVVAVPE